MQTKKRLPFWLRNKSPLNESAINTEKILKTLKVNSICKSAKCPNKRECFSKKIATFLIMGNVCTRRCNFCAVSNGSPEPLDEKEGEHVAKAVEKLKLKHVVITSVTRDDLIDGGASQFVSCIKEIRKRNKNTTIEILTPDFNMNKKALKNIILAKPQIFNHNIETIPRLYSAVRPQADYHRSLNVLSFVKNNSSNIFTKTGLMVGLGEKDEEIINVMKDLRDVECDILTIGQYLQPSKKHLPVVDYIKPIMFDKYKEIALNLGFKYVASAPLVRSSYNAEDFFN